MPAPAPLRFGTRTRSSGFTLIELLVVVGIIALISGLLLPIFIRAREESRKRKTERTAEVLTYSPDPAPPARTPAPSGPAPILDAVDLHLVLASSYHRIGMDVFTRYQVDCTGQVVFEQPGPEAGPVLVSIPFPENALEARDVQLEVHRPGAAEAVKLGEVAYRRDGIYFTCPAAPGEPLTADVRFTALGRDQLDYSLPPGRQLRSVRISLDLPGVRSRTIPDDSLQPSSVSPGQVRWEFQNLVSDRHITVQIPAAQAPLARALVLTRLVALAVLLFGAGFWFLSEQVRPGQLDRFRWGHFLLLALTYSLFFVIFAVLEVDGKLQTSQSLATSAVFSLPLLVLHVARVLDLRFAVTRVVPLALFTLGVVLVGVYAGDYRDYAYIGATVFVIAYVTLGYEGWASGRAIYHQEREQIHAARRTELIDRITRQLGGRVAELCGLDAQAAAYLKAADRKPSPFELEEGAGARTRLERAREAVPALVKEYDDLAKRLSYLGSGSGWEAAETIKNLQRDADALAERLQPRLMLLQSELAPWRPASPGSGPAVGEHHCAACGRELLDAAYCPHCGSQRPQADVCAGCGERIFIPVHLLGKRRAKDPLFCPSCGTTVSLQG